MYPNNFQHQDYERRAEPDQFDLLSAQAPPQSDEISSIRKETLEALRRHRVVAIYLVHGTFVGDDVLGLFRKVASALPSFATRLSHLEKKALDALAGDDGNYTSGYAKSLERVVHESGRDDIRVRLFHWSGENSHIGRCDGSVRLLDDLIEQSFPQGSRVLLWGHSHGGNVLAVLTNLLGADMEARERFFRAAAPRYAPLLRCVNAPEWNRVREALTTPGNPLHHLSLDIATFGTPVRYGWDVTVAKRLLHFVNHRPSGDLPPYQVPMPRSINDVLQARYGDVVQQFGVAGTGLSPGFWSWRARISDRRLRRLLQAGVRRRDLLRRLNQGKRVADAGRTLLIDYHDSDPPRRPPIFGHAVYTQTIWQIFHLEQVVKRFYQSVPSTDCEVESHVAERPSMGPPTEEV